jgi:hypothetical protein
MSAPALASLDPVSDLEAPLVAISARPDITIAVRQGATRCLVHAGYAPIWEFSLANNRRADICGLSQKGELAIVEVKSGILDFKTDTKWREYAPFCDLFYFAVAPDFPLDLIPSQGEDAPGLIVADAFGAEIIRPAPRFDLAPARRKAVTLSFARHAAMRALRI